LIPERAAAAPAHNEHETEDGMAGKGGRVAGKVALVTGGASGLGAASAKLLAAEGAAVMITDLNADKGRAVADEIVADGGKAAYMDQDVVSEARWIEVVAETKARFGKLNVLVASAGIGAFGELMSMTLEEWRRMIAINLDGVFLGMRHCGPAMVEAGGGSIINLSSILGKVGSPGAAHYCASKGGVLMLTKAAALEWAPLGIRVNSVHPGYIDTAMVQNALHEIPNGNEMRDQIISKHALGRLGVANEIAEGVLFLASDASSFMTGAEMVIDGGYTAA
jgi:NAD(P)-dependent dehydrogenase (short-subunit alcohol dehydrogenase family)